MMTFGDFVSIMFAVAVWWAIGAIMGILTKGFLKKFTMPILVVVHVALFVALVCSVNEYYGFVEFLEEFWDMDLIDALIVSMFPAGGIMGSYIGQMYTFRIEKR